MDASNPLRTRGLLSGFANSADLPLPRYERVPIRRILRADTPQHLSQDELTAATSFGFSTVLDLRSEHELSTHPHPLATSTGYRSLPLIDPVAEAQEDFSRFHTLGDIYSSSLQRNAAHIAPIFAALADAAPGPVLLSCRAGRDRTGMVIALLLDLVGVDRDVIIDDYSLLPEDSDRTSGGSEHHRTGGDDIRQMLEHVSAVYGSTDAYLRWLHLDDHSIKALQRRLRP
ncbi:tyrosine-protein phosphatase [Kineococcus radiotolerans]|uniref:Protein tyrosine/serine phosphatase n=1 Tax=Kineococcus radiotolerans (strain ATCC BAA-149 / DSM 14245 / SRS30216) TaxID=266940 RepID=A6WAP8_KINRD|nr:tyrosine-protein phosphatase [Kineococcus radiotolerans]ABS03887.1 protein tyrosine/serine phosphatase [Kineococcus radiotolerans SRS30216 = ATCC BAA-149]